MNTSVIIGCLALVLPALGAPTPQPQLHLNVDGGTLLGPLLDLVLNI